MNYKILIVDDELDIRDLLSMFLENEGFEIETAVDGLDAIEKINISRPNLVISDIRMPRCNGFELFEFIVNMGAPCIPVLFISGYVGMDIEKYVSYENFAGFISKPMKLSTLKQRIHEIKE